MVKGSKQQQQQLDLKPLESWADVESEVEEIAYLDCDIEGQEAELNRRITEVQGELGPAIQDLKAERDQKEARVLAFAKKHRADFGDKKSKKVNFGTITFSKAAEAVKFLIDEIDLIANLKRFGYALMPGLIKQVEKVDKDALKSAVPEEKREKVGFEVVPTGDTASLKIDKKRIELMRQAVARARKKAS
jgi:phage host-nuclease inhibitor protein Gam